MTIPSIKPGGKTTPGQINALVAQANASAITTPRSSSTQSSLGSGFKPLSDPQGPIYGLIVDRGELPEQEHRYQFVEAWKPGHIWVEKPLEQSIRSLLIDNSTNEIINPATEINFNEKVPIGVVARLTPGPWFPTVGGIEHREWYFDYQQQVEAFEVLEDSIPNQMQGGGVSENEADVEEPFTVKGHLLSDEADIVGEFHPPFFFATDETLYNGVMRQPTQYYKGTKGWARWVARLMEDDDGVLRWRGAWQIVAMNASTICHAKTPGSYDITDSAAVARTFTVAENLEGFIEIGDTLIVANCTLANNGRFTVTGVTYASPDTTITVTEAVGADNEAVGNLGKVILDGEVSLVDLWWLDEDKTRDKPELIDSEYDLEAVNFSGGDIAPGLDVLIYWDRQEHRWHLMGPRQKGLAYAKVQTGSDWTETSNSQPYVDECRICDADGTNETGLAFRIWLPRRRDDSIDFDPDIYEGDVIPFQWDPQGRPICVGNYLSSKIGDIRMVAQVTEIPTGWVACTPANKITYGCVDFGGAETPLDYGRFPKQVNVAEAVGDTGGLEEFEASNDDTNPGGGAGLNIDGIDSQGTGISGDPSGCENRPPFVCVHFIQRVA